MLSYDELWKLHNALREENASLRAQLAEAQMERDSENALLAEADAGAGHANAELRYLHSQLASSDRRGFERGKEEAARLCDEEEAVPMNAVCNGCKDFIALEIRALPYPGDKGE